MCKGRTGRGPPQKPDENAPHTNDILATRPVRPRRYTAIVSISEEIFLGTFRQQSHLNLDSITLQSEMERYGYVLIRDLIPTDETNRLLAQISTALKISGWIHPSADPIERLAVPSAACADGDPPYKDVYDLIFNLESFHALPHLPALQEVMKHLVGPELLIHPRSAARLIFPNYERAVTPAHQDHTAVAGDSESFTAWMPLHDCPLSEGPLRILEGSHRFGLQPTGDNPGCITSGTEQGDRWVEGELRAGDVLIFHSLTVHEALPNLSNNLRISLDCRFQNYLRPVNPGTLVFSASRRRSWEKTYANWQHDDLKYYWRKLPLTFKPNTTELADLAESSQTPRMRTHYANILLAIQAGY